MNYSNHLPPSATDIRKVLDRAIERLSVPADWCQRVSCLDERGEPCSPLSPEARRMGVSAHLLLAEVEMIRNADHHQFPIWNLVHRKAGGYAELNHINDEEGREATIKALEELREDMCGSRRLSGR